MNNEMNNNMGNNLNQNNFNNNVNQNGFNNNVNQNNFNNNVNQNGFNNNINQNGFNNNMNGQLNNGFNNFGENNVYKMSDKPDLMANTNFANNNQNSVYGMNSVSNNYASERVNNKGKNMIFVVIGVVAVIVLAVVLYSVFGGKTLSCSISEEYNGLSMRAEVDVKFKKNKAKKANVLMEIDLGEYSSYADDFIEEFEAEYDDFKDKGVDVKLYSEGNSVFIEMKASENKIDAMDMFDSSDSYDEVKADLEDEGFICK